MVIEHYLFCRMSKDSKIQVQKQNSLVNARYRLSLHESWIFNYGIAKTNYKNHCYGDTRVFNVSDIAKFYNVDMKYAYTQFKQALKELFKRECTYYDNNLDTYVTCRLITEYHDNKRGIIAFKFSDQVSELIATDKNFLAYKLEKTKGMTSPTATRIYEILLNRLKKHHKKLEVDLQEFKKILGFENEYKRFCDFNRRVLKVAQKQINDNKHVDISFTYETPKNGRVVEKVIFFIKYKNNNGEENKASTDIPKGIDNPFDINKDMNIDNFFLEENIVSDEDRKKYIEFDLKEYIGIDDFMISKYLKDYGDKLNILEQQIRETLDADEKGKIIKTKASHFAYYLKFK